MIKSKAIIDAVVESDEESTRHVMPDGSVMWRNASNRLHRRGGPALEHINGNKEWRINGKLHRLYGPARVWSDGGKQWYVNGRLHRLDGPATEYPNGAKEWYIQSRLHRLDGPARVWPNGNKDWYVDGRRFTEDEFYRYVDQDTGEVLIPPGKKLTYDYR